MKLFFLCLILTINPHFLQDQPEDYYSYTIKSFRNAEVFQETIDIKNPDKERLNAVIFHLTNEIRYNRKLQVLKYEPLLKQAAEIHSNNMKDMEFFNHVNSKSKKHRTPEDRARFAGITNPSLAENIIETFVLQYTSQQPVYPGGKGIFREKPEGNPIPPHTYLSLGETIVKLWMGSPGHKKNILSPDAVQLGCGTAFYLKEDFNDMPMVLATQNFQLYQNAITNTQKPVIKNPED